MFDYKEEQIAHDIRQTVYSIFPELKENEDEKIRKEIIEYIKTGTYHKNWIAWLEKQKPDPRQEYLDALLYADDIHQMSVNDEMVAEAESMAVDALMKLGVTKCWLEKQDEQKSFDYENANIQQKDFAPKVEPKFKVGDIIIKSKNSDINKFGKYKITSIKDGRYWYNKFIICEISEQDEWELVRIESKFKVGDWVVHNKANFVFQVVSIGSYGYEVINRDNYTKTISFDNEVNYHLWTIQDAKDGDVLTNGNIIVIFKHFEDPSYRQHIVAYIGLDRGGDIQITDDTWRLGIDKAKPATKEQRDLLFSKMKEAGYEWDDEKKELKLLITNGGDFESENCEQNPAWSEEDEIMVEDILDSIDDGIAASDYHEMENWLKSLKERIKE